MPLRRVLNELSQRKTGLDFKGISKGFASRGHTYVRPPKGDDVKDGPKECPLVVVPLKGGNNLNVQFFDGKFRLMVLKHSRTSGTNPTYAGKIKSLTIKAMQESFITGEILVDGVKIVFRDKRMAMIEILNILL